jgi:hypothetical protein
MQSVGRPFDEQSFALASPQYARDFTIDVDV